ncbi:hypothetical protein ND808_10575, partial [Streptomyces sp. DR7-3]|nr:hypothetical protein [Streptomyces sp. DR7-3]
MRLRRVGATSYDGAPEGARGCVDMRLRRVGATSHGGAPEGARGCVNVRLRRVGATSHGGAADGRWHAWALPAERLRGPGRPQCG